MIQVYMREDWSGLNRLDRQMPKIATDGAHATAEAVVNYINRNWSPFSPSARGGAPAKVTGRLERSVLLQDRNVMGRFAGNREVYGTTIYYRAIYAARLEVGDLERPFLGPAVQAIGPQSGLIFASVMRSGMSRI